MTRITTKVDWFLVAVYVGALAFSGGCWYLVYRLGKGLTNAG